MEWKMKTLLEVFYPEQMNHIKTLRKELGLTQVQFAELLGTTQITVSAWENGKCPEYIDKLAELALNKKNTGTA